jgi:hypothetical protein
MDPSHIADQLLTASTALSGLILVFIGNAVTGYDGYDAGQQQAVKRKYQRQGWLGFAGFLCALLSALLALLYNWAPSPCIVYAGAGLLVISLAIACVAAFMHVREIA